MLTCISILGGLGVLFALGLPGRAANCGSLILAMLVPLLLDGLICVGTVIAMPMGTDKDDFPAGAFLECLEDECLSVGAALEAWQPDAHLLTKKGGVAPDMGLAVAIKADVSKLAQAS